LAKEARAQIKSGEDRDKHMKGIPCHYKRYLDVADKSELTNVIESWQHAPDTPVLYQRKKGVLKGWRVQGAPHKKTGELLIEIDNKVSIVRVIDVTPCEYTHSAPWHHDTTVVWRCKNISDQMDVFLENLVPGLDATYAFVFDVIAHSNIPIFIVGGTVRDMLQNLGCDVQYTPKDVDIGFGGDAHELYTVCQTCDFLVSSPTSTSLIKIGKPELGIHIEGKPIGGYNSDKFVDQRLFTSFSVDLSAENIYRDFTANALWYDVKNKTIVDPTTTGVRDALLRILRIPVTFDLWDEWVRGNPTKLLRYWLFVTRGYEAADEQTKAYIINKTKDSLRVVRNLTRYHCTTFIKLGVMNNKTDSVANEKLRSFREAVEADLGRDLYQQYFLF
jgi:hypothetical protein